MAELKPITGEEAKEAKSGKQRRAAELEEAGK